MDKDFNLNDDVIMKKEHACKTNLWTITRNGADIKIKCKNCGRLIMLDRPTLEKRTKKVIPKSE